MALKDSPHPEERSKSASRRTQLALLLVMTATALLAACSPEQTVNYPQARRPLGTREALHAGHWHGQVGMTEVDYMIEQVSPTTVLVKVSGTVLHQANRSYDTSSTQNYFYDRPRTCKITADGRAFDCTRYVDMHIDNGLLCGVYEAPDQVYRPCLDPAP
jgi:hypothetical protein